MKKNVPKDNDNEMSPEEKATAYAQAAAEEAGINGQEPQATVSEAEQDDEEEETHPQFPLEALPPLFQETVTAVMGAYKVDAVLPAMSLLGINSASFGAGLQVQSNRAMTKGNLYLLAGAASGTCKSLVQKTLQLPLNEAQAEYLVAARQQQTQYMAEDKLLDAKIHDLIRQTTKASKTCTNKEDDDTQQILKELVDRDKELEDLIEGTPRLCTIDFTSQALALLLKNSNEQMAVLTAEGGTVLFNMLGRYTKGDITDDVLLCQGYSGDHVAVDRVSRPPILLNAPCITMFMAVQPDLLAKAFSSERLRVGGFLARCLAVDTKMMVQYEDKNTVYSIDPNLLANWSAHIRAQVSAFRFVKTPYTVQAEPAVYPASSEFYNSVVDLIRGELSDVQSFAIRWREQAWRIAVNLHSGIYGVGCFKHPLTPHTFADAILIAGFFAREQLRILRRFRDEEAEKDLARIRELLALNEGAPISLRDMERRHGFSGTRVKRLAARFPKFLAVWKAQPRKGSPGGRPSFLVGQPAPESDGKIPDFRT